ncbi:MAG: TerD family protein [Methylococcales bacterium]
MAISLTKGGRVNLTKEPPGLNRIIVGLGWNPRDTTGTDFDLDAAAFLLKSDGKVRSDEDVCFLNNKIVLNGAVQHKGDNLTGAGSGDDEILNVDLSMIPYEIEKISFTVTIYEAVYRNQNFGQVNNAYIRVVNGETIKEVARFDLTEDYSTETSIIIGNVYRTVSGWEFKPVGDGFNGGFTELIQSFGVNL